MRTHLSAPPARTSPRAEERPDDDATADALLLATFADPVEDRFAPVVITITLLLTLIIGASGAGGLAACLILCGICAAMAKVTAAGRIWMWLPGAVGALSALLLLIHLS